MECAALLSRDSIACANKCNLEEIITTARENNVRLRKKLDLIKYEKEKVNNYTYSLSRCDKCKICVCMCVCVLTSESC